MATPEGYVPLDLVGFTDRGDYESGNTYAANDIVHDNNNMYLSLQDNNVGHALPVSPETDTEWWQLWLSGGADKMESLTAKDSSNVMGGGAGQVVVAQSLIDAIAAKVINDLISKSMIDNNLLSTNTQHVLAAPQGRALKELIDDNSEEITQLKSDFLMSGNVIKTEFYGDGDTLAGVKFSYSDGRQYVLAVLADRLQLNYYNGSNWTALWSISAS